MVLQNSLWRVCNFWILQVALFRGTVLLWNIYICINLCDTHQYKHCIYSWFSTCNVWVEQFTLRSNIVCVSVTQCEHLFWAFQTFFPPIFSHHSGRQEMENVSLLLGVVSRDAALRPNFVVHQRNNSGMNFTSQKSDVLSNWFGEMFS